MKRSSFFIAALAALQVAGCTPPIMPPDALQASLHEPYMLNAGDKLRIIIFGQDAP